MVRQPAVAGTFYPGGAQQLRAQLQALFPAAGGTAPALGVVVPHAGYVYSGRVAAAVYARVALPDRCIILGPNHTGRGAGAAIMSAGEWETPLGRLAIDAELAAAIRAHTPGVAEDPVAHAREHSIEVQLPFLQHLGRPTRFVPLCLLRHEFAACADVGQGLAAAVSQIAAPVLLVASTDMSHYLPRDQATALDRRALDAILALDAEGLHAVVRRLGISMCGVHAVTAMLVAARALGAGRAELVRYTDSGEAAGDTRQVVGYAGLTIS
jgi:AmmeMemoRadiSam system protein B